MDATLGSPAPAPVQASPKKNKTHSSPKKKTKDSPKHTLYFHNSNREHTSGQSATDSKRPVLIAKRRLSNNSQPEPTTDTNSKAQGSTQKFEPQPSSHRNVNQNSNHVCESRVAETFRTFQKGKAQENWRNRNGYKLQPMPGSRPGRRDRNRDWDDTVDPDANRKVLASGFPAYTQAQDLARVLSELGPSQILRCRNRLAVVMFDTEQLAQKALACSEELYIYGEFIQIYPYTNARHVDDLFRSYKKVITPKKELDIIEPSKIDLSGDFDQQFDNIQCAVRLSREEVLEITQLYVDLEAVLRTVWPGCRAVPFGSIPMGIGIKSSDADCFLEGVPQPRGAATFVSRARRALAARPELFAQLVAIPRANTPIVKCLHLPTRRHCDLSAKTPLGAQNSRLVKALLAADARLPPLAVLLKYWARVHRLSGTGRLTNYALATLLVFYLQQPRPGLAPPVRSLQSPAAALPLDHWDAGFEPPPPRPPCDLSTPELLGGFFQFYASFDFDTLVVCPLTGEAVPKAAFERPETLPPAFERYVRNVAATRTSPLRHGTAFCVQDPFELSHNVASPISARLARDIRAHFKHAVEAYERDRDAGSPEFLRAILLTRPKPERGRERAATRMFLIPRVHGRIVDEDWRARVRHVLLDTIFETMLEVTLEADDGEEALARDERAADMDKERYACAVPGGVWRRCPERRTLEPPPALQRRQAAVTRRLRTEPALRVRLELGFRDAPARACYALVQFDDGDLDGFRGFVRLFHSSVFDWFRALMQPWMVPADTDERHAEPAERRADPEARAPEPAQPTSDVARLLAAVSLTPDT